MESSFDKTKYFTNLGDYEDDDKDEDSIVSKRKGDSLLEIPENGPLGSNSNGKNSPTPSLFKRFSSKQGSNNNLPDDPIIP